MATVTPNSERKVSHPGHNVLDILNHLHVSEFSQKTKYDKKETLIHLSRVSDESIPQLLFNGVVSVLCELLEAVGNKLEPASVSHISKFFLRCSACQKHVARAKLLEVPDFIFKVSSFLQDACSRLSNFAPEESDDHRPEEWSNLVSEWQQFAYELCQAPLTLERLGEGDVGNFLDTLHNAYRVVTLRYLKKVEFQCKIFAQTINLFANDSNILAHVFEYSNGKLAHELCRMLGNSTNICITSNVTNIMLHALCDESIKLRVEQSCGKALACAVSLQLWSVLSPGLWIAAQRTESSESTISEIYNFETPQTQDDRNTWLKTLKQLIQVFHHAVHINNEVVIEILQQENKFANRSFINGRLLSVVETGFQIGLEGLWYIIPVLEMYNSKLLEPKERVLLVGYQVLVIRFLTRIYTVLLELSKKRNSFDWLAIYPAWGYHCEVIGEVLQSLRPVLTKDELKRIAGTNNSELKTNANKASMVQPSVVGGTKHSARETVNANALRHCTAILYLQRAVQECVELLQTQFHLCHRFGKISADIKKEKLHRDTSQESHSTSADAPSHVNNTTNAIQLPGKCTTISGDIAGQLCSALLEFISSKLAFVDEIVVNVFSVVLELATTHPQLGIEFITGTLCDLMQKVNSTHHNNHVLYCIADVLHRCTDPNNEVAQTLLLPRCMFQSLFESSFQRIMQAENHLSHFGSRDYMSTKVACRMLDLMKHLAENQATNPLFVAMWDEEGMGRYTTILRAVHTIETSLPSIHQDFVPSISPTLCKLEWIAHEESETFDTLVNVTQSNTEVQLNSDDTPPELYDLWGSFHGVERSHSGNRSADLAIESQSIRQNTSNTHHQPTLQQLLTSCTDTMVHVLSLIATSSENFQATYAAVVSRNVEINSSVPSKTLPGVFLSRMMEVIQTRSSQANSMLLLQETATLVVQSWKSDPHGTLRNLVFVDHDDAISPPMLIPLLFAGDAAVSLWNNEISKGWPLPIHGSLLQHNCLLLFHIFGEPKLIGYFEQHHIGRLIEVCFVLLEHALVDFRRDPNSTTSVKLLPKLLLLLWRCTSVKVEWASAAFTPNNCVVLLQLLQNLTDQVVGTDHHPQTSEIHVKHQNTLKENAPLKPNPLVHALTAVFELLSLVFYSSSASRRLFSEGATASQQSSKLVPSYLATSLSSSLVHLSREVNLRKDLEQSLSSGIHTVLVLAKNRKLSKKLRHVLLPTVGALLQTCTNSTSYTNITEDVIAPPESEEETFDFVDDVSKATSNNMPQCSKDLGPIPFQITEVLSLLPKVDCKLLEQQRLKVFRCSMPSGLVSRQTLNTVRMSRLNDFEKPFPLTKRDTELPNVDERKPVTELVQDDGGNDTTTKAKTMLSHTVRIGREYAIGKMQFKVDKLRQRAHLRQKTKVWELGIAEVEGSASGKNPSLLLGAVGNRLGPGSRDETIKPVTPRDDIATWTEAEYQAMCLDQRWKQPGQHLDRFEKTVRDSVVERRNLWNRAHEQYGRKLLQNSKEEDYIGTHSKWLEEEFGIQLSSRTHGDPYEPIIRTRGIVDRKDHHSYLSKLANLALGTHIPQFYSSE